ncbi:hypothetical protein E2320_007836 [Naja naja]|nr:hypothetical protein E2320_007836 [Naja naja]
MPQPENRDQAKCLDLTELPVGVPNGFLAFTALLTVICHTQDYPYPSSQRVPHRSRKTAGFPFLPPPPKTDCLPFVLPGAE